MFAVRPIAEQRTSIVMSGQLDYNAICRTDGGNRVVTQSQTKRVI